MLLAVSSEQHRHDAALAFDASPRTYWQSKRSAGPHYIAIDLGTEQSLRAMVYTPQTVHGDGMMAQGILQVSVDGERWNTVESFVFGNLINDPTPRSHHFTQPVTTRYIRIEATGVAGDGKSLAIGELDFL